MSAIAPRLVVNALLYPGETIGVYVSHTTFAGDSLPHWVEDAQVELWEEGEWVGMLPYQGGGKYGINLLPKAGKAYRIRVQAAGFETVSAADVVPLPAQVEEGYFLLGAGTGEMHTYWGEMHLSIKDQKDEANYYELLINPDLSDVLVSDPAWVAEGDRDFRPTSLFFSDALFDGQIYTFNWKSKITRTPKLGGTGYFPLQDVQLTFRTGSEHYYRFRKSWTRHRFNQGPGFTQFSLGDLYELRLIGDPTEMYTNVQGGLGIFAAYNEREVLLRFIE